MAVAFILFSAWKEMERSKGIENEVAKIRAEASRIRSENQSLSERIMYFSTGSFEEREAKEKLGMKRIDEEAVAIDVGNPEVDSGADPGVRSEMTEPDLPNYKKWWGYFFNK